MKLNTRIKLSITSLFVGLLITAGYIVYLNNRTTKAEKLLNDLPKKPCPHNSADGRTGKNIQIDIQEYSNTNVQDIIVCTVCRKKVCEIVFNNAFFKTNSLGVWYHPGGIEFRSLNTPR